MYLAARVIAVVGLWLFGQSNLGAAPAAALGYEPKYPSGFSHFDYVNPEAPKGGELTLSGFGTFDSLNPFLLKGVSASGLMVLTFETLMEKSQDEPFSLYGLLAEDIALAEDKLSVTFRLNPQARFADGTPVRATDVKFSFDTLMSEQAHPRYRFYWQDVQAAQVIDEHTVRFNFHQVNPELHLIIAELPVFSKAAVGERAFDQIATESLVTTGPYGVKSYEPGKYITYHRNKDYWATDLNTRRGLFNFDKITFKYYKDREISLEALKAGEFDFMDVYNSKAWARDYVGPQFNSGRLKKQEIPNQNNQGMQGFVFNLRQPIFQDVRVRQAINLAFDFHWANKNLFYGQYKRCDSYFSNSPLAATGLPTEAERALLEPFKDQLPEQVFTEAWRPVTTQPPHSLRKNLRQAKKLLTEAGWILKDGVLQKQGLKLEFEALLVQKGFDRILAPFARNLEKLGIKLSYRTIDTALYQRRLESFDFDMTVIIFAQSQSPGNELINYWHSSSADKAGSNNFMGLKDPVVDALIKKVIDSAYDREALVSAVHALDRVMLHGEYVVPNWYTDIHRIAYWDKFGRPEQLPLYYQSAPWMMSTWWLKHNETTP